ncbi:MAG: 16S rRNA (adenine(1518)-N(6)/adenine(1519)-N(6))-dimethyltransferase RsmA [Bacteroidales bacterium OttesenSCG-928-I14]|nr:16S rRNA (adenine(1518)-N(6)/adenine(1519)-N(6))-dimethyltransferase RsmA [Bacteroidales bacterium OttesenSCG-928-I14]
MCVIRPKKFLGQHFLKKKHIARRIADTISFYKDFPVLEIGPGMGAITKFLLQERRNLTVVEIDRQCINFLKKYYPQLDGCIIEEDFLKLNLDDLFLDRFCIVGNYPYNISTQIFFKILNYKNKILCCSGLLQKEVAKRLISLQGRKTYGIITVLLRAWYDIEYLFTVSPDCFSPSPKVNSAVIRMIRNKRTKLGCDELLFTNIVKTAFNKRRKTLRNSLKSLFIENNDVFINPIFDKRPEQLSVEEFIYIARMFTSYVVSSKKHLFPIL